MNNLFLASLLLICLNISQQKTKPELGLSIDYLPTTEAFTDMKLIQTEYEKFKAKVNQNVTTDFEACLNSLETLKCNNIDQWQSVIEELQLEIKNSQDIELPFLEQKKTQKTNKLKELIEQSDAQAESIKSIIEAMTEAQKEFEINSQQINQMFKLPIEGMEFIQQPDDVPQQLNADVPQVAQKELKQAAKDYKIGDQSIQAQTTSKEMHEASQNMGKTLNSLQASIDAKQKKQLNEKKQLKEDIIRLRALINNEHDIQSKNSKKIKELKLKIQNCKGMPTSIEKDCLPIKLKGDKLNTELEIINSRTLLLAQHIQSIMKGFESEEDIESYEKKKEAEKKLERAKKQEQKFMEDKKKEMIFPEEPKEQKPILHFTDERENNNY